jgi:hypothetical protein
MKKSRKVKILFFCLIPVGIIILVFSIKLAKKTFSGKIILEIPYSQKSAEFILPDSGTYSIWHRGQFFRKAPLDEFIPEITSLSTGSEIKLSSLLFRPNQNNGKNARMEIFRFHAPAGKYTLKLIPGSSISAFENSIINLLPVKMVDYNKYFIQVRTSQPTFMVIVTIVLLALAGFCIIGGFVFGLLADQIFTN